MALPTRGFSSRNRIHAPPMAETVLGMILFFGRGLRFAVENQREARWDTAPYYAAGAPLSELSGLYRSAFAAQLA